MVIVRLEGIEAVLYEGVERCLLQAAKEVLKVRDILFAIGLVDDLAAMGGQLSQRGVALCEL